MKSRTKARFITAGLSLCMTFNAPALAAGRRELSQPDNIALPACKTSRGEPVTFEGRSTSFLLRQRQTVMGVAERVGKKGTPFVYYDRDLLPKAPVEVRNQVLYHECAHHENGDTNRQPPRNRHLLQKIEDKADCRAIRRLRDEFNYSEKEIDTIATYMHENNRKLYMPHNIINRRINLLKNCLKEP